MRQILLALVLLPALVSAARAEGNHYAAIVIRNPTPITVHFQFKWGKNVWHSFTLAPGEGRWFGWPYAYTNENESPPANIRFDSDLSTAVNMVEYHLCAYAVPFSDDMRGKRFDFHTYGGYRTLDLNAEN